MGSVQVRLGRRQTCSQTYQYAEPFPSGMSLLTLTGAVSRERRVPPGSGPDGAARGEGRRLAAVSAAAREAAGRGQRRRGHVSRDSGHDVSKGNLTSIPA